MLNYIHTFYKFHYIIILSKSKLLSLSEKANRFIPIEWQLILINEGSFTQITNYLDGCQAKLYMLQKNNNTSNNINRHIRCIWLENFLYTKLVFARSIWLFTYLDKHDYNIKKNQPIGNLLINAQTDIYKKLINIFTFPCTVYSKSPATGSL